MKRLFFLALLALSFCSTAQPIVLSPSATAALITCGPGDDFYTSFGHSALRITDTTLGIDNVYNYGCFDFNTPNLYWHFTRGSLDYCLCRSTMDNFLDEYQFEGRWVRQQRLRLSPHEVANLFVLLETNYQPAFRYYRYDILRDNCATRVRDALIAACGNQPPQFSSLHRRSYRQHLYAAMHDTLEWWRLGCDLLLGLTADQRCSPSEAMFAPFEMYNLAAQAQRSDQQLAEEGELLLPAQRTPPHRSFPPVVVFSLLFLLVALLSWRCHHLRWLDRILFLLAGIAGLFLLFMWFGTSHWCTNWNLNLLWLSPLLILIAIRLDRSPRWALWLQEGCFLVAMVWVLLCNLSPAIIPLILTLALRTAMQGIVPSRNKQ